MKRISGKVLNRAVEVIQRPRRLETYLVQEHIGILHVNVHPLRKPELGKTLCGILSKKSHRYTQADDVGVSLNQVCPECRKQMLEIANDLDCEANDIMDNLGEAAFNRAGVVVEEIIDAAEQGEN